ncbi:saccharopine dehydrogenase family protein [Aquabacterium sp.]|uniref:saccharopine dehydrogenase family protein n=1 Tax=Aquabacterium sp. TaxID=1872578 RepID=UPI003783642C
MPLPYRVLVLGGYGFFGRRLVTRLAQQAGYELIVAGRSQGRAQALVAAVQPAAAARLRSEAIDVQADDLPARLRQWAPHAVVHAAGPFQGQDYRVAQACIAAGAHYIDLADGREFVAGITALHRPAAAAGVAVVSGASSVPALSCAAVDALADGLATVQRIDIGISPGNRTERGLSTVRAILGYCGQPLPAMDSSPTYGWSGRWEHAYPAPVGPRLLSPCDVPDLTLLPPRYPGRPSVRFGAGLELRFLHRGMNLMALLARWGLVRDWSAHAALLKRAGDWFTAWGSDAGAMHVAVQGLRPDGQPQHRLWHLLATSGDGPYVPTLAAAALLRRWRAGPAPAPGARPCLGLLSLADFRRECEGLQITLPEGGGSGVAP